MGYAEWSVLPRDELEALFQQKTGKAIAAMFDITYGAVYSRIRAYGIKGPRNQGTGPKRRFNPDPAELQALLDTMSMRDIARHYGVGETVVFYRVKQHGLSGPSRSERLSAYAKNRPLEHKLKIVEGRRYMVGERAPGWKGGVSGPNKIARTRAAYRTWKEAVVAQSNFVCSKCGVRHGDVCECCGHRHTLHAHHLKPFSGNPTLRYDPTNGVALCGRCHRQEHFGKTGELLGTP